MYEGKRQCECAPEATWTHNFGERGYENKIIGHWARFMLTHSSNSRAREPIHFMYFQNSEFFHLIIIVLIMFLITFLYSYHPF